AVRKPRGKAAGAVDAAVAVPVERPKRTTAARKPAAPKTLVQTKKDEV
ncbi:MAG TPA: twin-arginine translocase subunit TatB, partial [Rhizobium sp.]|nr:twin-arginine translocase subunit TatB [Rhizobium sp.]